MISYSVLPRDGGFWLVGARRSPRLPPLFGKVRWSGPHALADALGNLPRRVSVGFAARLEDVDDAERCAGSPRAAGFEPVPASPEGGWRRRTRSVGTLAVPGRSC